MNAKRWLAWVCLALMIVAEVFLLRANHDRDAALTDLRDAQHQLREAQTELDALKNSSAGAQAAEIASLRKQNEALTAKASALQKNVERLEKESQQTSQHLTTARTALQMQQENLQQLQAEQERQAAAAAAAAATANANACIANLHAIEVAKARWALDKNKDANDVPTTQDLLPYLKDGVMPVCPDGGVYTINSAGALPTCSIPGHVLPPQ
jgi:chromosome segregation ATPase